MSGIGRYVIMTVHRNVYPQFAFYPQQSAHRVYEPGFFKAFVVDELVRHGCGVRDVCLLRNVFWMICEHVVHNKKDNIYICWQI